MQTGAAGESCRSRKTGLLMKRTLKSSAYRLRIAFGRVKAVIDIPEKFKEEPCKKPAATASRSGTVFPTTQVKPLHGCKVSLPVVQQITGC